MSRGGERERLKTRIIEIVTECEDPGFRLRALANLHPNIFNEVHLEAVEDLKAMLVAQGFSTDAPEQAADDQGPGAA